MNLWNPFCPYVYELYFKTDTDRYILYLVQSTWRTDTISEEVKKKWKTDNRLLRLKNK